MLKKLVVLGLIIPSVAFGSTTDNDFDGVVDLLKDWSAGGLGKIFAGEVMLVGIGYGVVRQNVMSTVISFAVALTMLYGPDVLIGIMGSII